MAYKLIAFDLDGTLLDDSKNITEENLRALEAAAGMGVTLVPATGRVFKAMPDVLKDSELIRYYILSNGAYIYDKAEDRVLYKGEIPLELALKCIEYMDKLPVIYDCYKDDSGYMTESMYNDAESYLYQEPHILELVKKIRIPVPELSQYLVETGGGLQKLQMFFKPEDMALREKEFSRLPEVFPELRSTSSVRNNVEINSVNAGKGRALLFLARMLGIKQEETAAFGDGTNDAEMLIAAGCGVAMANAYDSVKAQADMVTLCNNDSGVAYAIRKLLDI